MSDLRRVRRRVPRPESRDRAAGRGGVTILELLVVVAVLSILLALLLPAVQQSRAASRRTVCQARLKNLGIAASNYATTYRHFPVEERVSLIDWASDGPPVGCFNDEFASPVDTTLVTCPSDPNVREGRPDESYVFNAGSYATVDFGDGVLPDPLDPQIPPRYVGPADVTDGLSQTALMSEKLIPPDESSRSVKFSELGRAIDALDDVLAPAVPIAVIARGVQDVCKTPTFVRRIARRPHNCRRREGYKHSLTPNSPNCQLDPGLFPFTFVKPASSRHDGGVNVLLCDGSVHFASDSVDGNVWYAVGTRAGGEPEGGSF